MLGLISKWGIVQRLWAQFKGPPYCTLYNTNGSCSQVSMGPQVHLQGPIGVSIGTQALKVGLLFTKSHISECKFWQNRGGGLPKIDHYENYFILHVSSKPLLSMLRSCLTAHELILVIRLCLVLESKVHWKNNLHLIID